MIYAVIYGQAGCVPDTDYPEFVGTLQECQDFIRNEAPNYERRDVEHDLYALEILELDNKDEFVLLFS